MMDTMMNEVAAITDIYLKGAIKERRKEALSYAPRVDYKKRKRDDRVAAITKVLLHKKIE